MTPEKISNSYEVFTHSRNNNSMGEPPRNLWTTYREPSYRLDEVISIRSYFDPMIGIEELNYVEQTQYSAHWI